MTLAGTSAADAGKADVVGRTNILVQASASQILAGSYQHFT